MKVLDTECKFSQFADDTTTIADGFEFESSFLRIFELLDAFASISGLYVSYEKTEALWIGSMEDSNLILPLNKLIIKNGSDSLSPAMSSKLRLQKKKQGFASRLFLSSGQRTASTSQDYLHLNSLVSILF